MTSTAVPLRSPRAESSVLAPLLLAALLLGLPACRGCGTGINPVDIGFRAEPASLEFGRVLEGSTGRQTVTLSAVTRAGLTVTVAIDHVPPFDAPQSIDVPGGGSVDLPVQFLAGSTAAIGTMTLTANEKSVVIALHGTGVRPPVCIPSAPCLTSTYSLEEDRCIEAPAPDNAACDPGSMCLEQGRCRSGVCLGVARSCNDNDECTDDGCAMETGCVHTPHACPTPTNPCHVPTCDMRSGCGEAFAFDGTPCGTIDCVSAHLCFVGACQVVATPEGFTCSTPIACLGAGQCHSQRCVRPDAGEWQPAWSARLEVTPSEQRPVMLAAGGNLFFAACGLTPPPGFDAGVDAGVDGGSDGGADAGDGGDDGGLDGGVDAGPPWDGGVCGLVSYTLSGFERFTQPFDDGAPRALLSVGPRGVLVLADAGLEVRSRVSGTVVSSLDAPGLRPRMVASLGDGTLMVAVPAADGGSSLVTWVDDAGLPGPGFALPLTAPLVAVDEADAVHLWDSSHGVLGRVVPDGDGGVRLELASLDAGADSLALARGAIAAGLSQLVTWADGGVTSLPLDWSVPDAGAREPLVREVLLTADALIVFYRECASPVTSCLDVDKATWARAVDSQTGALLWETVVLPPGVGAQLVETATVDFTRYTRASVATLVHADFDAGTQAYLEIFGGGQRLLLCPLPEASNDVRGGLFAGSQMLVLVGRPDGGLALESYSIAGIQMLSSGWPQADGLAGERLAIP